MLLVAAAEGGTELGPTLASYGVAAPIVALMYAVMRSRESAADKRVAEANARAEKAEARSDELTERLLTQQAQTIPVLVEATSVIRATGTR